MTKILGLTFGNKKDNQLMEWGWLILRVSLALLMLRHGFEKFVGFSDMAPHFFNPFGLGEPTNLDLCFGPYCLTVMKVKSISLALVVGAEFFGALFILFGFLTRWSSFTIVFTMLVAAFLAHGGDPFHKKELALVYALGFFYFMLAGSGKYGVDHYLKKVIS